MGERVEEIKHNLLKSFPKLNTDKDFLVTSKPTPNYNCIAWACSFDDRWIQPPFLGRPNLDCVVWWPPESQPGLQSEHLIKLFESQGFKICDSYIHEDGFRKVALYEKGGKWTHASRELKEGFWTSKLGPYCDIQHGTPYTIENDSYGTVYCFMKKEI